MKTNGPWKIKKSSMKYKNPWIKVREDKVVRPDGKPGIFGVVEMVPGVSILPMDEQGYVYLVKKFNYAVGQYGIEVPGGAIDRGESALAAAKRELMEELGIEAEEWLDLGLLNPFTGVINSPANLYLARKIKFISASRDKVEKITMMKIKFADALKMVMKSDITHGQSSVLILKTAEYLRK